MYDQHKKETINWDTWNYNQYGMKELVYYLASDRVEYGTETVYIFGNNIGQIVVFILLFKIPR